MIAALRTHSSCRCSVLTKCSECRAGLCLIRMKVCTRAIARVTKIVSTLARIIVSNWFTNCKCFKMINRQKMTSEACKGHTTPLSSPNSSPTRVLARWTVLIMQRARIRTMFLGTTRTCSQIIKPATSTVWTVDSGWLAQWMWATHPATLINTITPTGPMARKEMELTATSTPLESAKMEPALIIMVIIRHQMTIPTSLDIPKTHSWTSTPASKLIRVATLTQRSWSRPPWIDCLERTNSRETRWWSQEDRCLCLRTQPLRPLLFRNWQREWIVSRKVTLKQTDFADLLKWYRLQCSTRPRSTSRAAAFSIRILLLQRVIPLQRMQFSNFWTLSSICRATTKQISSIWWERRGLTVKMRPAYLRKSICTSSDRF